LGVRNGYQEGRLAVVGSSTSMEIATTERKQLAAEDEGLDFLWSSVRLSQQVAAFD
jgi:hypothetical protein